MSKKIKNDSFKPETGTVSRRCTTCLKELDKDVYSVCVDCSNFVQCLDCLAYGVEKGCHLREHRYVIIEPTIRPIFREDWTLEQEILFIDALQTHGLGNYEDIHKSLPFKTKQEFGKHWEMVYSNSVSSPKPEIIDSPKPPDTLDPIPDYVTDNPGKSSPKYTSDESKVNNRARGETPGELTDFMPMRKEFEHQYMEHGEELVSDIVFDPETETPDSFKNKVERLLQYDNLVTERDFRTGIAIEFVLYERPFTLPYANMDKICPLLPYIGKEEAYNIFDLVDNIKKNNEKIHQMYKWRRNKIKTIREGRLFSNLEQLRLNGLTSKSDCEKWNRYIDEYNNEANNSTYSPESELLTEKEITFCKKNKIEFQLYIAIKDLLIRESSVRVGLTREEVQDFSDILSRELLLVFEFMYKSGWIPLAEE